MGQRISPIQQYNLTPKEVSRRRELALENLRNVAPLVTAEPVEDIVVEEPMLEDETEPIQSEPVTPALQTEPVQPETPAQPSSEPGKTAAVEKAMAEKPQEPDEFEQMFKTYQENLGKARGEYEELQGEIEGETARGQVETGIAGALQAFGEGLAAITGGSAKPVQTGAATMRAIGEQRIAGQERKARSLKERMMMAREPLETKKEELGFRDVFEKRQLQKRLMDPQSGESQQARDMANNFLDVYIANLENKAVEPEAIQRVEGVRGKIQSMNADQVNKFLDNLKSVKFGTSFETTTESKKELEETKATSKTQSDTIKYERKLQSDADNRFLEDSAKLADSVKNFKQFGDDLQKFQNDVKLAQSGNGEALKRVKQNRGVINYLIARSKEPKGVFTDQDLAALSQFEAGRSWGEVVQSFFAKGTGSVTPEDLKRMSDVLEDLTPRYQNPEKDIIEQKKRIYKASDNPYLQKAADKFTLELFGIKTDSEIPSFKTEKDAQSAINKGGLRPGSKIRIEETGEIINVGGK